MKIWGEPAWKVILALLGLAALILPLAYGIAVSR